MAGRPGPGQPSGRPRRPDQADPPDPVRITGPNPRLPRDARAARGGPASSDGRGARDPRAARNLRTSHTPADRGAAGSPRGPGNARSRRGTRPPRRPPRPPRWLTIRRGDPGRRVGITLLAIAVMLTLFAGRLVQIQGLDSASYKTLANDEKLTTTALPALRGTIYSSDHQILAMATETYQVWADPHPPLMTAAELPTIAQQLSGPLGLPAAKILSLLQHPTSPKYVVLATGVPVANDQKIEALSVYDNGIYDQASYAMAYPNGQATANVVGYTNVNPQTGVIQGQAGVEEEYNKLLTGTTGSEEYEYDPNGEQIPGTLEETPAQNGDSIKLTINSVLQYDAMKACENEVDKSQAKSCTAVIIQPKTGDILAMAQWPTWNQATATPANATDMPDQDIFTPGSTAKVITAAAAFEHGGKTPMSAYNIPYQIYLGGQYIRDAEYTPNERYTIAGIIANSSNVGMSQVVESVPPQTQYDYLRNFGLAEPTGLGLPGETAGLLQPPSQWAADERYTLAYGQGIAVSAIQMASVYATIANDGVRVAPRLVEGTYNAAGQYTPAAPSKSTRVIQPKTAKELISILQQVPGVDESAEQPWGIIPGYAVASKTGTANESPNEPGESCPSSNPICIYGASYIGMAPGNGPQVVVAVNVQDPNKSNQDYFGDMVAGPVFYNVMKDAIAGLGIQPQPGLVPPDVRLNAP
jgi:cell division protein FtsI (penicillin-binding protein 3)